MDEGDEERRTACYDEKPVTGADDPLWRYHAVPPAIAGRGRRELCAMDLIMLLVSVFTFCLIPAAVAVAAELISRLW